MLIALESSFHEYTLAQTLHMKKNSPSEVGTLKPVCARSNQLTVDCLICGKYRPLLIEDDNIVLLKEPMIGTIYVATFGGY